MLSESQYEYDDVGAYPVIPKALDRQRQPRDVQFVPEVDKRPLSEAGLVPPSLRLRQWDTEGTGP
jgi:hypothetical protein